jgi:hypothetical protein
MLAICWAGVTAAFAQTPPQCGAAVSDPVDCSAGAGASLTQKLCEARGCCWHQSPTAAAALAEPAGCINGQTQTPKGGVTGSNVWTQHISFPDGKINDGDPISVEITGYVHDGKHGGPGPCCGNKFSIKAANATERGFDLVVTRAAPLPRDPGWGQELLLGWKAGPASCKFPVGPSPGPSPPPPPPLPKSQCFYPKTGSPIETVHMINSNHFDAV